MLCRFCLNTGCRISQVVLTIEGGEYDGMTILDMSDVEPRMLLVAMPGPPLPEDTSASADVAVPAAAMGYPAAVEYFHDDDDDDEVPYQPAPTYPDWHKDPYGRLAPEV